MEVFLSPRQDPAYKKIAVSNAPKINTITQQDRFIHNNCSAKFFPNEISNMNIGQGFIGNCQSLSVIDSLSRNPKGAVLLRNMVKMNPNNKSVDVYFACKNGEAIKVDLKTIEDEKNFEDNADKNFKARLDYYIKYLKTKNIAYKHSNHKRPLGVHAIEHAYAKYQKETYPEHFADDTPQNVYNSELYHASSHIFMKDLTGLDLKTVIAEENMPKSKRPSLNQASEQIKKEVINIE